jgi:hypothetical protein
MRMTRPHHGRCIFAQAWDCNDIAMVCTCPPGWPRRVCANCLEHPRKCHCVKPELAEPRTGD